MSFLGSILGLGSGNNVSNNSTQDTKNSSISGAETIERLCDRLQSSSLLEDRRESLKTIKQLSKKYKLEVGTQAMPVLIDVLDKNRLDSEMCCLALDSLYNVMITDDPETSTNNLPNDLNIQFTEMFIKTGTNISLIFDLLDEFEFQTRWCTLKLLNALIINQAQQLQDIILQIPRGVSRLMDLLNDSREIIRNDTILLLNNLTTNNTNIQKIIAFESGFDRIMEIIEGEGSAADGGIVVEDCFNLLLNLLKMNYSNQNYFKEANYIKLLSKYLDLTGSNTALNNLASDLGDPNNSGAWTMQKTKNLTLLLKLIRCLVAPTNQQVIINDCQQLFNKHGMLLRLCAMLMMFGVPADLLSEAISTVGEVIRGNKANQEMFAAIQMQSSPARPIVEILLMTMINEKQPFHLRCSILYCFECYLYKNEKAKTETVENLFPKTASNGINPGQLLCSGLIKNQDFVSNWLCAVALSHTINDSNELKEQLLRVQLVNNVTNQPMSLMQQCMTRLIESTTALSSSDQSVSTGSSHQSNQLNRNKLQTTVSMLMLLSTWLSNCPLAVNYFLSETLNIPYLISQVSSTDTEDKSLILQGLTAFLLGLCMLFNTNQVQVYSIDQLRDTIKKRCGIEQFEDKLEYISQHELYTKTLKMPTFSIKCKNSSDLLFDYEFTRLFKSNETLILNLLHNKNNIQSHIIGSNAAATTSLDQQNTAIMSQYQQIIREQDIRIKQEQQEKLQLAQTCAQLQEYCHGLHSTLSSKDDYLKERIHELDSFSSDKLKMHAKINELEVKNNLLEEKCSEQEDELCKLQREKGVWQETINNMNQGDISVELIDLRTQNKQLKLDTQNLNKEQEDLLTLLQEMESKLKQYKKELRHRGYTHLSDDDEEEEEEEEEEYTVNTLSSHQPQQEVRQVEQQLSNDTDDIFEPNYNNRMSEIINNKQLSNSTSSNSVADHANSSLSTDTSCSSNTSSYGDKKKSSDNKILMNYPPQTGQNIVNATNTNPIDPFFQNHPFFSQTNQTSDSNSLQNYFK